MNDAIVLMVVVMISGWFILARRLAHRPRLPRATPRQPLRRPAAVDLVPHPGAIVEICPVCHKETVVEQSSMLIPKREASALGERLARKETVRLCPLCARRSRSHRFRRLWRGEPED